jgi:NADPH:quinone reductase-like Zn-dependent oxidoreductase
MIAGTYGRKRDLPAIGGREGVGEIVAVGKGVDETLVGRFAQMDAEAGTWVGRQNRRAEETYLIPSGVDPRQAALSFINPTTAWRLLHDFGALKPGDWVVQNAGNSAVGQAVIALSRELEYKTLSEVRDPAWVDRLKGIGADEVVLAESDWHKDLPEAVQQGRVGLAINSVGGMSVVRLLRALSEGGCCVTIGGMVGDPIRYPTRDLIFRDLELRGFWLDRWSRERDRAEVWKLFDAVLNLVGSGKLNTAIAEVVPLSDGPRAVAEAAAYGRSGKTLLGPVA